MPPDGVKDRFCDPSRQRCEGFFSGRARALRFFHTARPVGSRPSAKKNIDLHTDKSFTALPSKVGNANVLSEPSVRSATDGYRV